MLGEWNGFSPEPMTPRGDGSYSLKKTLDARDYAYRFSVSGAYQLDPENPFIRYVAGTDYSKLSVPDCAAPLLRLDSFSSNASGELSVAATYLDGSEGAGLGAITATLDGEAVEVSAQNGAFTISRSALPNGKHTVRINATDSKGRAAEELYLPFWVEPTPFRFESGAMYFALTDRFRDGNPANNRPIAGLDPMVDYRGGDWAGIAAAINEGYFDALGVKTIWISPVDANPDTGQPGKFGKLYSGFHGYWPSKARTTQPRFGSMDDLRALTAAAHSHGIRIVSDLVLNHVHQDHPYFTRHKDEGWFHTGGFCVCGAGGCDWEAHRIDCWFTDYLPDFDWQNSQLQEQLQSDALYWLKEGDLDGFRVDAVKHFEHAGARAIAGALHRISAQTGIQYYLVGETFTGVEGRPLISEYIGRHELNGQFDFPIYWPIIDAIAKGGPLSALSDAAQLSDTSYPAGALNSVFIGNHDVPRFISTAANQLEADPGAQAWGNKPPEHVDTDEPFIRLRDALTVALTLPGVPLIYYGDEVGMPGAGDPDNRRMMRFGSQLTSRESQLLSQVQKVGAARAKVRGLQSGTRTTLLSQTDVWAYQRDDVTQPAIVVIDREASDRTVTLTFTGELAKAAPKSFTEVLSGRTAMIGGASVSLPIVAHTAAVWVPTDAL